MAFQTSAATNPSPGIEGGFAGNNPYFSMITPDEGMFVAGATGPFVGRFAWAHMGTGAVTSAKPGSGVIRVGFLHRDQPVIANATILAGASLQVLAGAPVDLAADGTFWARFAAGATIGQKVFASTTTGAATAGAAGATIAGSEETAWVVRSTAGNGELAKISIGG